MLYIIFLFLFWGFLIVTKSFNAFIDKKNFLVKFNSWSLDLANEIARREGFFLVDEHFKLIFVLRKFYERNEIYPNARIILSLFEKFDKKINSCYLNSLFPDDSLLNLIKVSGFPNKSNCI